MLRIGDAARRYSISSRTLRYWEEAGILQSGRAENGYRYYDEANAQRIRQIVLLRRLEMPIAQIEQLFASGDFDTALAVLTSHLQALRQKTAAYSALAGLVESLLQAMGPGQGIQPVFALLEEQLGAELSGQTEAHQIPLSERTFTMPPNLPQNQLDNVRLVKLPAMTVAAYRAESETPEDDCSRVFNPFVLENALHKRDGFRQFGFNNPSPSMGNPVYGYEMWVTVPEDFEVPAPLEKKQFPGGLYASISTHMNEIGERWGMLYEWSTTNADYRPELSRLCLEECTMDFEAFISDTLSDAQKQLDLLEAVKPK